MSIDRLPPINKQKGQRMRFVQRLEGQIIKPKKPAFPVVKAKQAAKVLESLGKSVTGIHAHGDGGITVFATTKASSTGAETAINEWDEVLPHG